MNAAAKHAFAEASGGGLLLDLVSGALLELNESAAFVWKEHLADRSVGAIVPEYAARYSLDTETARLHVASALDASIAPVEAPKSDFNYEKAQEGYRFDFLKQPVFAVSQHGDRLRLLTRGGPVAERLPYLLRAVAPKLLALRGRTVLHASAISLDGKVIAFSGLSGSGKTTTVRSFADARAQIVCEDQLLLFTGGAELTASIASEGAISAWIARKSSELDAKGEVDCDPLDAMDAGERLPVAEIGFMDVKRRSRQGYRSLPLNSAKTAGAVFRNTFYGSDAKEDWIRHLETAVAVGRAVMGFELSMPEGLDRLRDLARDVAAARTLRRG